VDDVVNRFTDPAHQADSLSGFVNFVAVAPLAAPAQVEVLNRVRSRGLDG
jgi:hypothetical protein